jgi:hypothetical protein
MSKAENDPNTTSEGQGNLTKRSMLAAMAGAALAIDTGPGHAAPPLASPAYLDAVAAYERWLASCAEWGKMRSTDPEYERQNATTTRYSEDYHVLFKRCCESHRDNPTMDGLFEVYALWRIRCWEGEGPAEMSDEFEARALCTIIEALSGRKPPQRLLEPVLRA